MHTRAALRLLTRPIPRLLAEHARPTTRSAPRAWPSSSRSPSLCFCCSIRSQLRHQSTSATPPPHPPSKDATPPSKEPPTKPASDLPSTHESDRPALQARFSAFMDRLQTRMLTATQTLNDLTGYSAIESIKAANARLESDLASAQARLRAARQNYKSLTNHRASTQREVTTLLARKDTWSPSDLERFTTLYRSDHELEAKVARASAELTEAESEEGRLSATLNAGILRRYHEEQIWSDRIRRASTWGTWGLMGVNVLLFIGLQFVAEPWKRRRLVKGFAEAESGVWEEVRKEVGEVRGLLLEVRERKGLAASEAEADVAVPAPVSVVGEETVRELEGGEGVETATTEIEPSEARPGRDAWKEVLMDAGRWKAALADLYSERRIDLSMRDASILALEGAATGAAVAAGLVFMVLRRS